MTLANVSNQLLRSQGNDTTTVAANYPITGDGSTQLPLGLAEDYRGADGESLAFNIADITDGHRVTISGSQGSSSFDVLNGQDGANGVNGVNGADGQSVTFDITNITNGHRVMLSGEQGSSSFDVMNGDNGVDGVSPTFRFAENADGITVIVSGAQGEESFTLYNGEDGHEYSAGPNIDITDYTISGKDWTAEIASSISSVSGNYYPMTGNPSGFLTAVDLSNYYSKNETSSREEISVAIAAIPVAVDYSAGDNIVITNHVISGRDWSAEISDAATAGGAAISGQYTLNDSTVTADCSAFCMYEQANSTGSYQLMATANNASWHGYGYTMSRPENLLMDNVSSVAQNYAASAVSSHVRLMNYPDITFSAVHNTFKAGGIVVPYETTQGYGTFYNFVASSVSASTSSYKFNYIGTNGYATTLTVSSRYNGAETGVYRDYKRIFLSPSESECKVVIVATSGDIPASGATDNKLYVVTGT